MWDLCILTATNESQASVYQLQLDRLLRARFLHPETEYLVISDPAGKRIGSGGATLHVLRHLEYRKYPITGSRILLIHSGGDSRRIPYHSILGKVFAPLPSPSGSVFEMTYHLLTAIGNHIPAELIVACGDTPMRLGPEMISVPEGFDVVGVGYWGSPELGQGHGVYDAAPQTNIVRRCLQKFSAEQLQQEGVCNPEGLVAIDTGILLFYPNAVAALQKLAQELPEDLFVELYGEMLPALATHTDEQGFIYENPTFRRLLWDTFHPLRFGLWTPRRLEFFHTGTTQEYLELLQRLGNEVEAHGRGGAEETSESTKLNIGTLNVQGINVPTNRLHFQVPLDHGWVHLSYDISDIPTLSGEGATLFGEPLNQWLQRHGLQPEVVWEGIDPSQRCLWNARLYPVYETLEEAVANPQTRELNKAQTHQPISGRLSMAEVMQRADRVKAFAYAQQAEATEVARAIVANVQVEGSRNGAEADTDVRPLFRPILTPYGYEAIMSVFDDALGRIKNPLHRARLHKIAADLCVPFTEIRPM